MNKDNFIRNAIDESLSSIHFDAKDTRSVLRAVNNRENHPERGPARKPRHQFALAMAMTLIILMPVTLFTLHAAKIGTSHIAAAPGSVTPVPTAADDPHADPIVIPAASARTADESEAIRIARACFESVCDTSIFTFEEYAVDVIASSEGDRQAYTVTMVSIYGNGCTFTVRVVLPSGEVLDHSTPELATTPVYLDVNTPEIRAWYDKYGPHLITWPQQAQAEFSRRYEGGMLREAKSGELTPAEAVSLAKEKIGKHLPALESVVLYGYSVLYSERVAEDGMARYVVNVYTSIIADSLPDPVGTASFKTDGSDMIINIH